MKILNEIFREASCTQDPALFTRTDIDGHREAAELCLYCPAFMACTDLLAEQRQLPPWERFSGTIAGTLVLANGKIRKHVRRATPAVKAKAKPPGRIARADEPDVAAPFVEAVADYCMITTDELLVGRGAEHVRDARAVLYALLVSESRLTYAGVGRALGRHHTSVMYGDKRVARTPELLDIAMSIREQMRAIGGAA